MKTLFNFFGGKSITFAVVFTAAGVIGFFRGHLSGTEFVSLATLMQGWIAGRSIMDDLHERIMSKLNQGGAS
jgi:hydrogenase/urease accessory protein HupE